MCRGPIKADVDALVSDPARDRVRQEKRPVEKSGLGGVPKGREDGQDEWFVEGDASGCLRSTDWKV